MGRTFEEILNEMYPSVADNDGKDGANTAIPSFVSDYSEEGKQKEIKEGNLAFEQMQKHTGVIAPEEVEKIEAPKTYNEIYEETSKDVLASDLARKGVSVFNFDKMMKESAKSFNMENWQKTKRIADAKASDNVSADDVDSTIKDIFAQSNKNDLVDVEDVLSSLRYKDAEGNTYYGFKGKRLYGDDLARDIVGNYVDERNHWINMGDSAYREQWSQNKYGIPYEEFVKGRVEYLEDKFKPVVEAAEAYYAEQEKVNPQISFDGEPIIDNIGLELGKLRSATNAFRDNTFWRGVEAGSVEAIRTATFDFGGVLVSAEQEDALNKYLKGEELNAKERLLVEMAKYNQILGEEKSKYRKGFDAADVGEGLIGSIGFMASLGAQSALGVGKSIGKELAEASVKEAFNRSIKEGVKLGLAKTGAWMGNTSARTALSTMPYQDYAQRRLSHFQFTDNGLMKEEVNPFADMYRAYASTFAEIAAEDFGGLLDDGMKAFGVKMANAKFFNKLSGSKFADRLKDFTPAQAVIGGLKGMKLNSMVGEVAEEYVTAAIQPLVTGEFFSTINEDGLMPAFNKHYADALTSEFALNTFAVCGALSAGGTLAKGVSGAMTAVEITNLRKDTKALLEGISDESLRNTLYTAINSNEADRFAPLAQMKWNSISADDASAALKVIFNDAKTHAMRGEAMETERLKVFSPYLLGAINKSYRGVDVANPTPTTEVVDAYALDEAGNEVPIGNVIYGDMDNPNAIVQVVDANGMVRNVPVAGTKFVRTSLSDYISEQYAMMFSTSISKERLNELIENVRGITKMDKEAYDKVLEENGFSVYRKGENVVLADGRFGTVRGGADSGSYIVDVTDANGNKTTELVGFESILHPTDLSMAEAQAEAQAEGSMDAPIVLPTTKDGRVSLDGINDGKVLARVLPSQMGGKQKAIEAIDAEIQRLETEQGKPTKQTGLDAMAEANERAESTANRIKVLQDARKALAEEVETPTEQTPVEETATPTAEEVESKRRERQAEMDAMSTFDFSRDYRRRNLNSEVSRNTLHKFIDNINDELKKVTDEAERKVLEHRKAQYEQTLKDMGAKKTIGEDAEFKALVEKASEALGLPIIVTDEPFANSRQNGKHRVSKDGNAIYINSRSTRTEQSVGILAHEIVHEFKQFLTPEEWAKFEGVIMTARFGKDWANSEAYKKEIKDIQDAERRSGHAQGVGDEKAREEAVAYAIQDYIFKGADGVRAFEAIVNQNLNWRDKLMEALRKVVDKLKSLFNGESKAVQEAIAEFENVFKRYAQKSGEIKAERIEGETAAIINEKDGQSSFSLSTYEDGGRDILQSFLDSQVEGGKLDQKDANAILTEMDAIYDICMDYKDEYAPFGAWSDAAVVRDGEGMPVFSVIKANGDYAMNLDFSLVCKKRRTLDAVLNEMIGRKLIEIAPDDPTFIAKVNDIVRKYGFETACRLCFVDAKRFRVVSTARNFCKLYNGVVAKLMPTDKKVAINSFDAAGVGYPTHEGSLDTLADSELNIKALEDILKRNGEKTVIAKIARHLLEHPEDRKLVHISDFVSTRGFDPTKALNPQILSLYNSKKGSGGPKASFSDVQYLNDVIYADWNKEDAYAVGGVRVQSFSDYVPRMVFDYMQMVADLAAKQMPVHAYTKETAFAKTFGLTGMKINMSLVPTVVEGGIAAGLDADGNYAWEEGETFDYDTAIEIQNADGYRENCGTIAVGVSDEHIDKMLDDDNIRMVIPYHKSGLNKAVAIANNIDAFKDYTNQQNTRYADGTKLSSADSKNVPNFNEDTRRLGDPRKAADAYLAWCKENNYKPKFDKWASHPNYYKLLEDFTTLVDGEYFEQRGVTMTFPKEGDAFGSLSNLIAESLEEDAVLEGKRDSLVGAMVDEIESTLFSNREKALESSNSIQKQPNTQEVVSEADVVESYSISRNNEVTIDKWLGKREDFTDEVKNAFKEFIADFKPATQLATTKWFANGVIRIPEDMPKVEQAMEIAQRKKVDALQYNSPMELIEQFGVVAPKEKLINPDDVPTLSNKTQVPNTDITIYDVDDSEESRKNFRELMNSHLGKESSPWCLLQADKNGVLTKESARYWKHYNRYPKRAAFSNGKLVAFFASDGEPTWWDRMDKPHSEIPIVGKIKGDELGRTATMLYNESGELVGYDDIHKGDRKNGLYEEWYNLEQMHRRGYFKDGQRDGVFETWHPNGVREAYAEFVGNLTGNLVEEWNHRGTLVRRELKNDSGSVAATALWYNSGKQRKLVITTTGHNISRAFLIWDVVGNLEMFEYTNGNISEEYDYQFQKYIVRNGGERKEYNLRKINAKKQKARAEKIREMYHADKVADIESIEDVDKMLEKISNDLASTKDSFSIDRSQYLEEPEIDRAYTSRQMDRIEDNAKKNNPFGIAQSIDLYEKFAVDEEKKKAQGKMSAIEEKYAQEVINSYRAVANYGRAILAEQFPDYAANTHANNLKSGKTNLAMVRGLFQEYNSDEYMAELFDLVSSVAEKFGTTFRLATIKGAHGNHVANTVQYNTATLNSGTISDQDKARIILHEMIHAATGEGVELCENARLREVLNVYPSTKLRTSVRRLKTLLEDIRNNEEFKGEYGITTVHEMLAELSNPRFVEKLKAHTIWTRVVDAIREIAYAITKMVTGKDLAKSDAYTEVRTTLTEIIEETPMEFIEGLNRLRDAGRIKGVKPLEAESVEEIASLAESEGTTSFSLVRDEAKIAELEASPKRIGYRNVILNEDGSFSSPMATHIGNTGKGKVKSATFNLGEWEEAEENPQLVDEKGQVYIYKDNGGSVKVAYDPYIHNRLDKVNAQFKEAWKRPNLVYVETEVPITDLESGYHADKAKLPVGVHSWSNGDLMLSRYDKPIRIVSWEEVADDWVARFKDRGVEFDIVPPALLPILKERGVEILPPHKGLGADATEAYEASRGEESFSILREEDTDTIFATAKEEFASTNDWLKTGWLMPDGTQLDFAEGGDYRGTDHRAIGAAYKGVAEHQWQYLQDFESRGGIRIHMNRDGKYGTIEMTIKPTAEQKKRLRSFIGAVGGNVDVDFMDENYNTAHSASYEGVSPARVLSGITSFYDEGIKPKGNVSYSVDRLNKRTVEKGFGGIWIADKQEFAKFASAVRTTPHEEDGEGIAFTDNYFYAYYRNIDGQPIPFASVYMNRYESQDVVNEVNEVIANVRKGERAKFYFDRAVVRFRNIQNKDNANDGDNQSASHSVRTSGVVRRLLRKGGYYANPHLYVKTQRTDIKDYDEIDNTNYSLNRTDIDYLDAVNRGDIETERADIERVAKENGTWLKAPNGKDTNLSPEQWVTVRTKAFKDWFGDWENDAENASKNVDENGEPKVVWHATKEAFTRFSRKKGKRWVMGEPYEVVSEGFFFAPTKEEAEQYGQHLVPAFIKVTNPLDLTADDFAEKYETVAGYKFYPEMGGKETLWDMMDEAGIADKLTSAGYDGVIFAESLNGDGSVKEKSYAVVSPNQIKSATENIGTFDSANDDIRYSLNRDNTTVATPELEAEANEELSKEAKLAAELEEAQNTIDRMVRKLNAVTERKEMTFDEVKAFLLDSDTMSGLQEASAGQYKRIIRNVLNVLEDTPNKRIKVESLVDRIQRELLSARLNLANSNLKAVAKDFKSIITKKREGRNTRGEAIAKYVDNTTRKMMEQFIKTIEYAHSFTDENNKTTTKWENILLAGRIFTNDAIDEAMATLRESLVEEYDEVKDGLLSLLEVYKTMRDCAADVQDVYTKQVGAERDIQDIKEEIDTLQGLLDIYHSGAKGFGKALREIRGMGYNTISDAEARVKALQGTLKALRGEIHSYKQEEADSINRLVEAVKDMNTAILGVDKEGRVALKEELAKKREAMGEFKKGVFRSVRSPHYGKVSSESAKQADKLPYWQRRDMVRRGNVMFSDVTETFEFGLRRMDRMSIANEWLQDGIYYQFIMHPTDGVIARSDWRYKTEKGLRNAFEEEARKRFAPNVKEGKFKFSDLKERVKEKSGIVITTIESRINGEPVDKAKPTTIDLTVGQLLYIRAMVKQQGGINGYLTLGLKAEQIEAIVKETEERYPEFCEFDDWIRGEEGILEQIYKIRNEIYRKIYGRDLDHTEGYFPIERMKGAIKKSEDVGETIDASTISGGIGSNKKRVRNSTPMNIDVDYFEKLDKHISESIQWCAGAELIEKMNALLSSSEFRNILEAQGFSKTAFKNSFKRAIGERLGGEEGKDTTAGKVLNSIGKNAVVSNIAFNLNSALKQLVSISTTLSNEVSPKLWMYFAKNALVPSAVKKGVATLVDSFMGDDSPIDDVVSLPLFFSCYKWAKENVPTFANRADNETMGFDIFELEGVEKWDRFANKIKEWGMKPNVLMDLFTCSILTKTYYDYQYDRNIERGMTEQEAHDDARMRASVLMNQTQQSSEGAFVSKYQSDRLTGAAAFFRAGTVAYQNSQLGFDRNARSAYQNIATMLYDMYGKQGAYDKVIEYQAEQYENRGIVKDKAMKMAKADYRRSFLTQCNVLLHNMLLNNTLWAMSGVMTMYVAQAASFIALAFLGGSGYGDEATEISFENIHKEVAKQLRNSWWVYTIPMSQSLIGKPIADLVGVASTFTSAKHPATLQPLFDTKSAIDKLFTVIEKEDDEEVKLQMGALGLVAFDTATRYGLGLSAKNALRIAGGVYGIAKDGETENFMNVLSSPRYLTKEFAGRPRKDETMDEYTERVSGLYKIIHSFSKGEDVSKLRKQYIDRMDEIMFYDTDFDYDKFKEDKKRVERLSKGLVYSATYNDKANEYRYRLKENKADKLESMSDEQSVEEAKLAEIKANVNYIDKFLKANVGWDTDMAEERELLFRAEQEHIMNFLNEYANYKNIK